MSHFIDNLVRQGVIRIRPDERFGLVQSDIPAFTQEATVYKYPKLVVKLDDLWVQPAEENPDGLRLKRLEDTQVLYVLKDGSYFVEGTQPSWKVEEE